MANVAEQRVRHQIVMEELAKAREAREHLHRGPPRVVEIRATSFDV
ncbi:hypothetical protein GI364_03830 [Alicyclobacillus sp. SO9]|nr:hypothetical protein GI364_03830 [Alicyclobacillus sp. SO9]